METRRSHINSNFWRATAGHVLLLCALMCTLGAGNVMGVTLNVVASDGGAVGGYRWLVEEDATYHTDPTVIPADPTGPPTIRFHRSYMPVVAQGDETIPLPGSTILDPDRYYFVSVLPKTLGSYTNGGARFKGDAVSVDVNVNKLPLKTAQISVFAFEDTNPINNWPDLPAERGLEGFSVIVEDAGGRYGMSGGQMFLDAFGNPLGTTYQLDANGNPIDGDADGNPDVDVMGNGTILTDANGFANIKNLAPGKYAILLVPPPGEDWHQTTTIEGTKAIDAWVKSNEPLTLVEFGISTPHVFMGFVPSIGPAIPNPGGLATYTISGEVANFHFSRPPFINSGPGHTLGDVSPVWVGLNDSNGVGVYAQPVEEGTFTISGVPEGTYQLVIWDQFLLQIIAFYTVIVQGADVAMGPVLVPDWFHHLWNFVFYDENENGFPDDLNAEGFPTPFMEGGTEPGILEQAINIRWRDGTMYQSLPTDLDGYIPFDTVFPFFNWLVAEVDFARFKATGVTVIVDEGGEITPGDTGFPTFGRTIPQIQDPSDPHNEYGTSEYRTETGPVLTQGFQGFAGDTNILFWGKSMYGSGENGGITGIVFYEITRAEGDPRYFAAEPWEPGIARIQVNLYAASINQEIDGTINGIPGVQLADVDNYPFGWFDGSAPLGPEDVDQDPTDGPAFNPGDAVQITWTDSWDDSQPEGCPGDPADPFYNNGQCYDGIRNFNQVRPAVFDGGYAFDAFFPGGWNAAGTGEQSPLPAGSYIVEATRGPFQVYQHRVEEAKNVDYGDSYEPGALLLPPICVGDLHTVPKYLTLFGDTDGDGVCDPGSECIEAPFAWQNGVYVAPERPLCNRKLVTVRTGFNAAADFSLYTDVPIAAHYTGIVTNDLGNEFGGNSPNFIEKFGAPFIPIAFRDVNGKEVTRVYTNQWGIYNGLLPSTYSVNIANPSGVSPAMYSVCINDPGPIPNPDFGLPGEPENMLDPFFKPQFTQSCYTMQFMPGATTYLDTPVLPVTAFGGREAFPPDCALPDGTPIINSVSGSGPEGGGAYVDVSASDQNLVITSVGETQVSNPAYNPFDPLGDHNVTVARDYGFGFYGFNSAVRLLGKNTLDDVDITPAAADWSNATITATVPAGTPAGQYQLMVTRADGTSTVMGLTITVGPYSAGNIAHVIAASFPATPIQDAIDAASPGDLILVHPGTYSELVIMYKDVQLQGSGAPSTVINAVKAPIEKFALWQEKIEALVASDPNFLLPNQGEEFALFPNVGILPTERGPGILVMAPSGAWGPANPARIDGLTIRNADNGGAIVVNGYADYLEISNNQAFSNSGLFGGGFRLGHPVTPFAFNGEPVDADNDFIKIHHNQVYQNGAIGGLGFAYGGGISLYNGSDGYEVTDNYICGNFSIGGGAGIGHYGKSDGGLIARNAILFNHQFHQEINPASGGGIAIEGIVTASTAGSGSVTIDANLIQGNFAGAGDGGGIRLNNINGQDVADSPDDASSWWSIDIFNNVIVNNVTGLAGAGISMKDVARVSIINNTVACNDSVGTAGEAFDPATNQFIAQPAGIVSHAHSPDLLAVLPAGLDAFSNPELVNNIIWQNRSFFFDKTANGGQGGLKPDVSVTGGEAPIFDDLAVLGVTGMLSPEFCILTDPSAYSGADNIGGPDPFDPGFIHPYFNGNQAQGIAQDAQTIAQAAAALDEGGNFIDVRFGPLSTHNPTTGLPIGDYHIQAGSPAEDAGSEAVLAGRTKLETDFDGDERPFNAGPDIGADELGGAVAGATTFEIRVATGQDDAEETASGSMRLGSSDLELTFDGSYQTVGMRFNGVTIPQGATITRAYIQFQVDEISLIATSLTIQAEAIDDAPTFTTATGNISSRALTTSAVSWSPVPWTVVGEAGPKQQTPNIASLIQEVLNGSGWSSGNALVIIITGTGHRVAESYNGERSGAPLLHVEYYPLPSSQPSILAASFSAGVEGFSYQDDAFRGTSEPAYASGQYLATGGYSGGGLQVALGDNDSDDILGMSGGWQQSFTLTAPTDITLSFWYNLTQASDYEADEFSQVLVSIDGALYGEGASDYVAQISGDGNGGPDLTTGWQNFQVNLGTLGAGGHDLIIGGYNNKKTSSDESTFVGIDDILITGN